MSYGIIITRGDPYDTSYEVWAKPGRGPLEYGDGIYIGNYPIPPDRDSVAVSWTPPAAGVWYFTVTQVQRGIIGATSAPETG